MCVDASTSPAAKVGGPAPLTMSEEPASDPRDFSSKYNTTLSPTDETKFQKWANKTGKGKDAYDYDIKGAWKELQKGTMSADDRGHLGDKYKKPNHPTFSTQSRYHGVDGNEGGTWGKVGGSHTFTPSSKSLYAPNELEDYFGKYEKDVRLIRSKP